MVHIGVEAPVHQGVVTIDEIATPGGPPELAPPTLKFVYYPGSQQLILWLPRPGYQGYGELVITHDGAEVERAPVESRLNGSVQILWDTLAWPPGDYTISISHEEGWRHVIQLRKFEAGVEPPRQPAPPPVDLHPPERSASGDIIYRDGFGNVVPDLDLQMRETVKRDVTRKLARRLEYEGNYRDGTIIYLDGERTIRFFHEMCGGEMKFTIEVPAEDKWEMATGVPLSEREEIVAWVAERVKKEQASSWRYVITDRSIDFY